MAYLILIADDEPLVQIGLKSMLSQGFPEMEVAGTAANGKDALDKISTLKPDIVIADIKMPVMTGLELLEKSHKLFGPVPVFIILTAYEEFELIRKAMAGQAVDYLVKIELNREQLAQALHKAVQRLEEVSRRDNAGGRQTPTQTPTMEEFRQKFMLRLFNRQICEREMLLSQAKDLGLDFHYDRYIVAYGRFGGELALAKDGPPGMEEEHNKRMLVLYASCLNMTKEIVERYVPCISVSNDLRHFTLVFYFGASKAVAEVSGQIQEAIENARSMIESYFNISIYFGIGTAVSDPLEIPASFEEARTAQEQAAEGCPVRVFSHIVGANRRSGKDRLIASIQDYISENLGGKLQLNEVAEVFGLSPAYLSLIFKKSTEVGFSEYVNTRKIEKAKQMLLEGDMKIYEVADALGFESAFYFSRVFKKIDGKSPRDYIQSKEAGTN